MALALKVSMKGAKNAPLAYRATRLPFARGAHRRAFQRMAELVQTSSRRNFLSGQVINVRTGELLRSIEIDGSKLPNSVAIGSRLRQAPVLHFGWPGKNIRPRPFLYPAGRREMPRMVPILAGEIEAAWNRARAKVKS